jgi:hypothetical protein
MRHCHQATADCHSKNGRSHTALIGKMGFLLVIFGVFFIRKKGVFGEKWCKNGGFISGGKWRKNDGKWGFLLVILAKNGVKMGVLLVIL